jgi:hypothetical protein
MMIRIARRGAVDVEKLDLKPVRRAATEATISERVVNKDEDTGATNLMTGLMIGIRGLRSRKPALMPTENGGASTGDTGVRRMGHQRARPDRARQQPLNLATMMSTSLPEGGRNGTSTMTTPPQYPPLRVGTKIEAPRKRRRRRRRSDQAASWASSAASREKI